MFILYAILIAVPLGFLLGGRTAGLADLQIRWPLVITGGLIVQLLLFSTPLGPAVGPAAPSIYVASTAVVVAAIAVNRRISGMPLVGLGALSNLVAIVANGGYMPADLGAMASLGRHSLDAYSNSALLSDPNLKPLTDTFALPNWLPFTNVFSVGDVLIGIGIATVVIAAMRATPTPSKPSADAPAADAHASPASDAQLGARVH
jgi:Family of unknown function (DUF5317)